MPRPSKKSRAWRNYISNRRFWKRKERQERVEVSSASDEWQEQSQNLVDTDLEPATTDSEDFVPDTVVLDMYASTSEEEEEDRQSPVFSSGLKCPGSKGKKRESSSDVAEPSQKGDEQPLMPGQKFKFRKPKVPIPWPSEPLLQQADPAFDPQPGTSHDAASQSGKYNFGLDTAGNCCSSKSFAVTGNDVALNVAMDPQNSSGEMNLQIPLEIHIPAGAVNTHADTEDAGVASITRQLTKVHMTLNLSVHCKCSNVSFK